MKVPGNWNVDLQLLVTDLDYTLVGDPSALQDLNPKLEQLRAQTGLKLVYATGRSWYLYQELLQEYPLLPPDALILSVGTAVHYQGLPEPDPNWTNHLSQGWDREAVAEVAAQFPELRPQPASEQGSFKLSYWLDAGRAEWVIAQLSRELAQRGLAVNPVYSSGRDLDLLPLAGNKGSALRYLQQEWGIPGEQTLACGDSGNDQLLLQAAIESGGYGVVVGNAQPELLDWYRKNPTPHCLLAAATCAGGILEGLQHFGCLEHLS
ncbi:MAG: sucrose-phosphate phosphatase [Cyanobacteriota bacterium]